MVDAKTLIARFGDPVNADVEAANRFPTPGQARQWTGAPRADR